MMGKPLRKIAGQTRVSGFTLVEMLVATGLVVLIMMMFAQIYGTAIGTMTEQRGMANNDQKARTLMSLLRDDLQNMTYRQPGPAYGNVQGIVPLTAGDGPIVDPIGQRGYFYYAENDTQTGWDDVLQFTAMIRVGERGDSTARTSQRPFAGNVALIAGAGGNQPYYDDGLSDGLGQSRAAEIAYFLRNGTLYRRVLLLRDPLPSALTPDTQPTYSNSNRVYYGSNANYVDASNNLLNFYSDFDYSATRTQDSSGNYYLWFHSLNSLQNTLGLANIPLAIPRWRFGFDPVNTTIGRPVEYDVASNFLGRFTMQETSAFDSSSNLYTFGFPGALDASSFPNPFPSAVMNCPWQQGDSNGNGVLDVYEGGSRVGEDIIMTNVEAFDVEVFDPARVAAGYSGYADLGHNYNSGSGDFSYVWNQSSYNYGTRSYGTGADGQYGVAGIDDDGNGTTDDAGEYGWPGSDDRVSRCFDTWHPYASTTILSNPSAPPIQATAIAPPFRPVSNTSSFSVWQANTAAGAGTVLAVPDLTYDYNGSIPVASNSLIYVATSGGITGYSMPAFPPTPGNIVKDGTVVWRCTENRIGLRGIRITVRYKDVHSNLPRQVSIVHSFVE